MQHFKYQFLKDSLLDLLIFTFSIWHLFVLLKKQKKNKTILIKSNVIRYIELHGL